MTTMTFTTTVLPGGEIRVSAPQLAEGQTVTVTVAEQTPRSVLTRENLVEWLQSLPSTKTPEEWEQFERDFQEERNSWDR